MQVLDARSCQSIPNVMRWYNTMLSHPTISELIGTPSLPPTISSASSSAASHSQTNGVLEERSKPTAVSGSQSACTHNQQIGEPTSSGKRQQEKAHGTGDGQQDKLKGKRDGQQDKPKGKDAKGGKLAKNDVAKGQKKGGDKKEKPTQAPKGFTPYLPLTLPMLLLLYSTVLLLLPMPLLNALLLLLLLLLPP